MITVIKKGSILSIVIAVAIIVLVNFFPFEIGVRKLANNTASLRWMQWGINFYPIALVLILFIQGVMLSRLMLKTQFFEQITYWPLVIYLVITINIPAQIVGINYVLYTFIFLYLYNRLFDLHEDEMANFGLYIDIAVVFALGLFAVPNTLMLLPFILLLLERFAVFEINRLMLFLMSSAFTLILVSGCIYVFGSEEWLFRWWSELTLLKINVEVISQPALLFTYLIILILTGIALLVGIGQLRYMQTHNRKIFNLALSQLVLSIFLVVFSSNEAGSALSLLSLPIALILSFASYYGKQRLFLNLLVLLFVFAIVFTQIVYMKEFIK